MNLLAMPKFLETLLENKLLLIILAAILVVIVALIVAIIVVKIKDKKKAAETVEPNEIGRASCREECM